MDTYRLLLYVLYLSSKWSSRNQGAFCSEVVQGLTLKLGFEGKKGEKKLWLSNEVSLPFTSINILLN